MKRCYLFFNFFQEYLLKGFTIAHSDLTQEYIYIYIYIYCIYAIHEMIGLSRLWIRQLVKILVGIGLLVGLVIFTDFYFNFLPTTVQTRITDLYNQEASPVVLDIKLETCMTKTGCVSGEGDEWYRIPKNIYLDSTWFKQGYLYAKRVDEDQLKDNDRVVLDVTLNQEGLSIPYYVVNEVISNHKKTISSEDDVTMDLVKENGWVNKDKLWIKYGKYNMRSSVTAIDVLFGPDAAEPRLGWKLLKGELVDDSSVQPRLSVRMGSKKKNDKTELRIGKDLKFKILQLSDMHFSTGVGKCMDPFPPETAAGCEADPRTLTFIERVLDIEVPDFVVLTGDQVFGNSAPDAQTAMYKVIDPLVRRKIPYAMVFGNHDDEGSMSRSELLNLVSTLPYSLSQVGPDEIDGVGNYAVQVLAPSNDHTALTFYLLDSHKKNPNQKLNPGYDWIKENQLKYLKTLYNEGLKESIQKYTHIPLAMAFQHIPLTEYRYSKTNQYIGSYMEGCTAPKHNSGARNAYAELGVSIVSVGHDHVNDFCMYDEGTGSNADIWLCQGGGVGEGGYGGYGGYIRRVRLFEVDTEAASITTWKIREDDESTSPFDKQVLVNGGKPVFNK